MAAGKENTTNGLHVAAQVIAERFKFMAVGTGDNAPSETDVHLVSEVKRKEATYTVEGNTITWECAFQPGDFSSQNLMEVGMYDAESGGTLLYREVWQDHIHVWPDIGATIKVSTVVTG